MSDDIITQIQDKKEMSKEDADRLIFWLQKIENGLQDLNSEMKIYHHDLQDQLDKVKLKNTLKNLVNLKDQ